MSLRSFSRPALGFIMTLAALTLAACQEPGDEQSKKSAATPAGETATACADGTTSAECADQNEQTDGIGLADFCAFAAGEDGQGCFTCTPREIPNKLCIAVAADFDPKTMCRFDLDRLSCAVGGDEDFVFEFDQRSALEQVYDKLDLLVFGVKALLYDRLAATPALRTAAFDLLAALVDNKLVLMTGGDAGAFVAAAQDLVRVAYPAVSDAELLALETGTQAAVDAFHVKTQTDGNVSYSDGIQIVQAVLAALPEEMATELTGGLDFEEVVEELASATGPNALAKLMEAFTSQAAIADILADAGVSIETDETADE